MHVVASEESSQDKQMVGFALHGADELLELLGVPHGLVQAGPLVCACADRTR